MVYSVCEQPNLYSETLFDARIALVRAGGAFGSGQLVTEPQPKNPKAPILPEDGFFYWNQSNGGGLNSRGDDDGHRTSRLRKQAGRAGNPPAEPRRPGQAHLRAP